MLVHGRQEILALSERCDISPQAEVRGWHVDIWHLDEADVNASVGAYNAVLAGGVTDPVLALLSKAEVDLNKLLIDENHDKADITRSDLTEFAAAASLIVSPGCNIDEMHMPNIPKMSRKKSDSGLDVAVVTLDEAATDSEDLNETEHLTIASVKHTVDTTSGGMRWKLVDSLSDRELSYSYLTSQLRVLNGRLRQEGMSGQLAARIYLFLRDFPRMRSVDLFAIGVVDIDLESDLLHQIEMLPDADRENRSFRGILLPGLRRIHERCK